MALPILDGNQSPTTLSTIIVSNAHIPAHTVVSLGTQAITNIATAVSGVELGPNTLNALENITVTLGQVTITGGLTDAQLRASAVTIGGGIYIADAQVVLGGNAPSDAIQIGGYNVADNKLYPIAVDDNGVQSISGTVTANVPFASTTATFPDQLVALGFQNVNTGNIVPVDNDAEGGLPSFIKNIAVEGNQVTVFPNWLEGTSPARDVPISGTVTANIPEFINETSVGKGLGIFAYSESDTRFYALRSSAVDVGALKVEPISLPAVTIGSLPRPTWTDYSGTVVTADIAFTAISNTSRSYLLAQVTTGQIFLNIGATATTLNSVYFSAGQGFAWETSVPQGIVSIISTVVGTNYVLKEG
jgi:hypothetical protein